MNLVTRKILYISCALLLMLAALRVVATYQIQLAAVLTLLASVVMIYFGSILFKNKHFRNISASQKRQTVSIQKALSSLNEDITTELKRLNNELDSVSSFSHTALDKAIENIRLVHVNVEREKQHLFSILNNLFRIHDRQESQTLESLTDYHFGSEVNLAIDEMMDLANTQLILCDKIQMASDSAIKLCANQNNVDSTKSTHTKAPTQARCSDESQRITVNSNISDEIQRLQEYATQLISYTQQDMAIISRTDSDDVVQEIEHMPVLRDIKSEISITSDGLQQSTRELSQILFSLDSNLKALKYFLNLQNTLHLQRQTLSGLQTRITDILSNLKQKTTTQTTGEIEVQIKTVLENELGELGRLSEEIRLESKTISDWTTRT